MTQHLNVGAYKVKTRRLLFLFPAKILNSVCAMALFMLSTAPIASSEDSLQSCPELPEIVDIKPDTGGDLREKLKSALARDNTTIRLGPDLYLDFSDLSAGWFPIEFGRCVTLTSLAPVTKLPGSPRHGGRIAGRDAAAMAGRIDPRVDLNRAPQISEGRTPQSLGPVLNFGPHREDVQTFLLINCDENKINDGARLSGFRLIGPSPDQQSTGEVGIRVVRCVDVEISNMEITGWGYDAISIQDDPGADNGLGSTLPGGRIAHPDQIRIHNNFIHHNQHPTHAELLGDAPCTRNAPQCVNGRMPVYHNSAEGYGVNVGHGAWARISENVFDFNRHAIAAPGDTGGYLAERNLILKGGGYHGTFSNTYTHSFDVHGTGCWCSSDLCGNAGRQFEFVANAFQYSKNNAIKIRGKPDIGALISQNVFPHSDLVGGTTACLESPFNDDAINLDTREKVEIGPRNINDNILNFDSFGKYGVCDFDGDGVDDLFLATGASWWFSSFGEFHWTYLNSKKERLGQVRLGYFDNDLRCDVLVEQNGQWAISSGADGDWQPIGAFGVPLSEVQFGRFDPSQRDPRPGMTRHTTHAFRRAPDGQWYVTALMSPEWKPVQSSSFSINQLRFGDFTGDGVTDVLAVENGHWAISESGSSPWRSLNAHNGDAVEDLFIANMDSDDNIDDILRLEHQTQKISVIGSSREHTTLTWWRSKNGTEPWRRWKEYVFDFVVSQDTVTPQWGFVGRFGAAPGGGTLVIDPHRVGHFYSEAEITASAAPEWTSLFPY